MDTLHSGIRRIIKRAPKELGKADPEDLRSRPPDLPEMFRKDESHQRDRGSGRHKKDPPEADKSSSTWDYGR
jgi:hypothetical protein